MANFEWINKQGVRSDSGAVIQFTGRFTAEYTRYGVTIEVDVEDGGPSAGKPTLLYSRASFASLGSLVADDAEALFREALQFQGLTPVAY